MKFIISPIALMLTVLIASANNKESEVLLPTKFAEDVFKAIAKSERAENNPKIIPSVETLEEFRKSLGTESSREKDMALIKETKKSIVEVYEQGKKLGIKWKDAKYVRHTGEIEFFSHNKVFRLDCLCIEFTYNDKKFMLSLNNCYYFKKSWMCVRPIRLYQFGSPEAWAIYESNLASRNKEARGSKGTTKSK